MNEPTFPIMVDELHRRFCPNILTSVPWGFVEPHESQARANHDQTLARLAERGGLSPSELLAVVENRPPTPMPSPDALERIIALVAQWERNR